MRKPPLKKPDFVRETEKIILAFFRSIDPEKFSEQARRQFARDFKKSIGLTVKKPKKSNRGGRL